MDNQAKKKRRKWPWVVGGFILFFIIIGSQGKSPSSSPTSPSSSSSVAVSPAPSKPEEKAVYGLNEGVQSGDVIWMVREAKDLGNILKGSNSKYPSFQDNKTTSGKFIQLQVGVINSGKDLASITSPKLIDSQGREYTDASTELSAWIPEGFEFFLLTNLQPALPKVFVFLYEVPADATGLRLKVGVFNPKLIDLGL